MHVFYRPHRPDARQLISFPRNIFGKIVLMKPNHEKHIFMRETSKKPSKPILIRTLNNYSVLIKEKDTLIF